jgi:hypothetical protein
MDLSRMNVIKWLLEKLLTSFVTSIIIYFAPWFGVNLHKIGFGYIYTITTIATYGVSIAVYFLVPKQLKTSNQSE